MHYHCDLAVVEEKRRRIGMTFSLSHHITAQPFVLKQIASRYPRFTSFWRAVLINQH